MDCLRDYAAASFEKGASKFFKDPWAARNEFIPVVTRGVEHLVARAAIACFGVPPDRAPKLDEDLAAVVQAVKVTLRSGAVVEGELRWIAPPGQQRTTDCLNGDTPYLVVYAPETSYIVVKTHIAMVTET